MADEKVTNYEKFVVVDEMEWKFEHEFHETSQQKVFMAKRIIKHSVKMGTIEWNIAFNEQTRKFEFSCQTVATGKVSEVQMEFVRRIRSDSNKSYARKEAKRHAFTRSANRLSTDLRFMRATDNLFTIRILKSRSMFPDFTLESTVVWQLASNGKLRVGDQVFHINKQLLSMHSNVFDRMFNSQFREANQEEIELKHEPAYPAIFHDFLLLMFVPDALPNPNNVAALCDLANMYEVNGVRDKCQSHLLTCREMPMEDRYMLAGLIGNEELKNSIMNEANPEETKRIIAAVSKKAFSSY